MANILEAKYGTVYRIDTLARNSLFKLPFQILWAFFTCKNIIVLPAQNGVIVLSRLLVFFNVIFKRKLHYVVIGGWLQDLLSNRPMTCKVLGKFTGIYVETQTMMTHLINLGLENVCVARNFKPISILRKENLSLVFKEPYQLVTFSRVTEKKGVATAVDIVMALNEKYRREVYKLDIYGPIDDEDRNWFSQLQSTFTSSISYKGNVPFDKSVEILCRYFALLFPTQYYTEGVPGTIIDAYAAGVPVISSKWKSFEDVIVDGVTGYGYSFGDNIELENLLDKIISNPNMVGCLKNNCIQYAEKFLPENALKSMFKEIDKYD